jgi:hypothetical protein
LRGTPAHIAEKYIALARDAQSSGDPVLAENYLQHAEHYNRIIMAFREQQIAQGGEVQNGAGRPHSQGFAEPVSMSDDFSEDEGEFGADTPPPQSYSQQPRNEGQPRHQGGRYEGGGGRPFHNNRDRHGGDRGGDRGDRGYSDRGDRGDRDRGDRFARGDRPERIERAERPDRAPQPDVGVEAAQPPRRERPAAAVPHHEQPEASASGDDEGAPTPTPAVEGSGD